MPSGRRPFLLAAAALAMARPGLALPQRELSFPRDHGAHPDLRTEWWYITGAVHAAAREFGFQVTFFRRRLDVTQSLQSRFAARQLLFAHAALTDVAGRRLWHDQRIARAGFEVAQASDQDTQVRLRDWTLERTSQGYQTRVATPDFGLTLRCQPTQPLLLQGARGLSRKGPDAAQASYYYSQPQLAVSGRIVLEGQALNVTGTAWLDHEWSDALLHPDAVGWDWIGMNLDNGSALTAFQLRTPDGTALWDGGSFRRAGAPVQPSARGETNFIAGRRWTSPLSGAQYPVEWQVQVPAGRFFVRPVLDAQELDSRATTGAIYWEGLSDLQDEAGRKVGRGYLEMTGYAQRLRL